MQIAKTNKLEFFLVLFCLLMILLYLWPIWSAGDTVYVPPFDFLDIAIPMSKILSESGKIFAANFETIPNMMGGLPRAVYGSEFYFFPWLFYFFEPFTVFAIQETLIHYTAFGSMVLFLRYILPLSRMNPWHTGILYLTALCYALLPFFPGMGLSIPLLPLFFYLMLVIRDQNDRFWHWALLFFIPFFSSFVLVYVFAISLVVACYVYNFIRFKRINISWLIAISIIMLLYLIVEYRLILLLFFDQEFISHRTEFSRKLLPFWDAYKGARDIFLLGQSHTHTIQSPYIVATVIIGGLLQLINKRIVSNPMAILVSIVLLIFFFGDYVHIVTNAEYFLLFVALFALLGIYSSKSKIFFSLLFFILGSSIWYGFWYFEGWNFWIKYFPDLKLFDLSRYALLNPFIWYVLFGFSLISIFQYVRAYGKFLILLIAAVQIFTLWQSRLFYPNPNGLNFKNYYDTHLFQEISRIIGKDKTLYRVGSVGIPPAVSLFNGFYTVDGYSPNYPLEYKHAFREIIESNFSYNPNSYRFFEYWGSQCYLIAGDKNYHYYIKNGDMHNFHINIEAFTALGGNYILSGYPIVQTGKADLILIKKIYSKKSFWTVWLYRVVSIDNETI